MSAAWNLALRFKWRGGAPRSPDMQCCLGRAEPDDIAASYAQALNIELGARGAELENLIFLFGGGTSISHGGVRLNSHETFLLAQIQIITEVYSRVPNTDCRMPECGLLNAQCGWQSAQRGQQRAQCGSQNAQCELQSVPERTAECPMRDADLSNEQKHTLSTHTALCV